ncbi:MULTISPECIES: Hsp20/alpha crystallin family protein [Thermocrispum]|uniref:Hsp20/alpha crystallin family protein n=1 Tax=Thermocrispum agreste TaxID=37925 RepID=A0A2W4JN53_9PSEU|nr:MULTISPECIES: Hsp20/alpha crystallin family protein [Thermocrispum]PZM99901.1 MAG: Hsp20/alpha crystallin family protein [Thermocrispum agreste]
MGLLSPRRPQPLLPALSELFDTFPSLSGLPALFDAHVPLIEDELADGRYTVRAELPGMDPEKDITVSVRNGVLSIEAERTERTTGKTRSEFRYGRFTRSIALPPGAREDEVEASYDNGILTVTVALEEAAEPVKRVKITTGPAAGESDRE